MAIRRAPECTLKCVHMIHKENVKDPYDATFLGNDLRIKPSLGLVCVKFQEENEWTPKGNYSMMLFCILISCVNRHAVNLMYFIPSFLKAINI